MEDVFWMIPNTLAGRSGPDRLPWDVKALRDGGIRGVLSVNDGTLVHPEDFEACGVAYACVPLSDNAPPRPGDVDVCKEDSVKIGVISDTHGTMRGEALDALAGSDLILHAGDIGSPAVIEQLARIAPVVAVRGNNDRDAWAREYPESDVVTADGCLVYMLHDVGELDLDPAVAGFGVVVSGHSHKPRIETRRTVPGVPGLAEPRPSPPANLRCRSAA